MTDSIQQLLHETDVALAGLRFAEKKFSAQLAPRFNIFDYLRNDEMGVSLCLADLLNPDGSHGQGRLYLDSFVQLLPAATNFNGEVTQVQTEKIANGARRIDIYLTFKNGAILGIENKPWAHDQENQLFDYAEFIRNQANGKHWSLIYLCNEEPSEESIEDEERAKLEESGNFIRIEYGQLAEWLETYAGKTRALNVQVFVQEFAKFIRQSINYEADMSTQEQVLEVILKDGNNIRNAFEIANNLSQAKKSLMMRLKHSLESGLSKPENGWLRTKVYRREGPNGDSWWDADLNHSYAGFSFWFESKHFGEIVIQFEFDKSRHNGFFWGVTSFAPERPNADADKAEAVRMKLSAAGLSNGSSDWWSSWASASTGLNVVADWDQQVEPWLEIQLDSNDPSSMVSKILALSVRVRNALDAEN